MTEPSERPVEERNRLLLLLGAVIIAVAVVVMFRTGVDEAVDLPVAADLPDVGPVPDFASIEDVNVMKEAFFDYLLPVIEAQNEWLEDNRAYLQDLRARLEAGTALRSRDLRRLETLAERYRVTLSEPVSLVDMDELLLRVDIVPPSLALAQAAAESGWGRSRFAREGNNLFGEWCFTEGCGMVPQRRRPGASHEVTLFDSVGHAVDSYFRNLNSHPAYEDMRELRAASREENGVILGTELVDGLEMYSERRGAYLEELRHMIRINRLTRLDLPEEQLDTASVNP